MLFLGSILVISGTPISSWCGCLGLLILALFSAGLGLIVLIDSGKVTQLIIRWERKDVVYHFALQTAVDIQRKCPGAHLFIEEAFLDQRSIDPFLVAVADGEAFYCEVWQEPGFEK